MDLIFPSKNRSWLKIWERKSLSYHIQNRKKNVDGFVSGKKARWMCLLLLINTVKEIRTEKERTLTNSQKSNLTVSTRKVISKTGSSGKPTILQSFGRITEVESNQITTL